MQTFNAITSRIFDVVLAPFGHRWMGFDLVVWPVLAGVAALVIYKLVSNQKGIADAKRRIMVNLLEVVLYRDDLVAVLVSTARALLQNALYLGYNIVPMLVMFVPMTAVLVQIVANYAYAPVPADVPVLLEVQLAPGGARPWLHHHPAQRSQPRKRWRADRALRTPDICRWHPLGHQPVRPVGSRARQGPCRTTRQGHRRRRPRQARSLHVETRLAREKDARLACDSLDIAPISAKS